MLQDIKDDQWILQPQVLRNLNDLMEEDYPLDLLIYPRHLPIILKLLKKMPKLKAVVNHAAKPNIKEKQLLPWKSYMEDISTYAGITCKVSGLVTEADLENWTLEDLKPYVNHLVDIFGVDSLMFGSDWPVCLQAATYEEVFEAMKVLLSQKLDHLDLTKVFGENAKKIYRRLRV